MNTSILIRTDASLKKRFETQAKRQGLSMTFLFKCFMETYVEKPEILKVGFDEELLDVYWTSAERNTSLKKLANTLETKGF